MKDKQTDPEAIKQAIQESLLFKERIIQSLTWLITDAKYGYYPSDYSPELKEAIAVLEKLKKHEMSAMPQTHRISDKKTVGGVDSSVC